MIESGGSSGGAGGSYHPIVAILLLIVVALVAAELVQHKRRLPGFLRLLIYTYSEFVLLGLLIGPVGLGLIGEDLLDAFRPFLHLSLGGVGLIFGLQFNLAQLKRFPLSMYGYAFFQAALTFALCFPAFLILAMAVGLDPSDASLLAAMLAIIASVSAPQIVAHLIQEQQARGENAHLLQFITSVDAAFGLLVLALFVGGRSQYGLANRDWLDAVIWLCFSATVGITCGMVFHWLLESRASAQEMVLYLIGLVTLSSGVAATLHLSPLFVNAVFGATVANLSRRVEEIFRQMGRLERPLFIVLLILAGARFEISMLWTVHLVIAYLGARFVGKWLGCLLGSKLITLYFVPARRLGMGLVSQGGMALAFLINLVLVERSPMLPVAESVVVLAIIASEFLGPPVVRHVLVRAGEWRGGR